VPSYKYCVYVLSLPYRTTVSPFVLRCAVDVCADSISGFYFDPFGRGLYLGLSESVFESKFAPPAPTLSAGTRRSHF
jgi:hypothetical protein